MDIKYKIVEIHPEIHSIVVRYYTDTITEEYTAHKDAEGNPILNEDGTFQRCKYDLNIQLPVPPPTGDALHEKIMAHTPYLVIEEKIVNPDIDTALTDMTALLGQETEGESNQ